MVNIKMASEFIVTRIFSVIVFISCVTLTDCVNYSMPGSGNEFSDVNVVDMPSTDEPFFRDNLTFPKSAKESYDVIAEFLEIVETYERNKENCTAGTQFNLGEGVIQQYGINRFKRQALVAVNRANLLTRLWKDAPQEVLDYEGLFYTQVRNIVEGDPDIFAGGNCYDKYEYKDYLLFCPFAYRTEDGTINVKDLSVEYKYLDKDSEWFYEARMHASQIDKFNFTVDQEVVGRYRFTPEFIRELDTMLKVDLAPKTRRSNAVESVTKVLVGLRYLSKGDFLSEVAYIHGISRSTASVVIDEFIDSVNKRVDNIRFPTERAQLLDTKRKFYQKCRLPNIIGAVDGTLIPIKAPTENEAEMVQNCFHL